MERIIRVACADPGNGNEPLKLVHRVGYSTVSLGASHKNLI